ncbi:hypothetical protein ACW2Q0_02110 [Nocardia sp. R16R-3T]
MPVVAGDRHDWHGEWNYTINPEPITPTADSDTTTDDSATCAVAPQRDDLRWLHAPELTGLASARFDDLVTALCPKDQASNRTRTNGRKSATTLADRVALTLQKNRFATPWTVLAELVGISPAAIRKAITRTRTLLDDTGHLAEPTATTFTTAAEIHEYISCTTGFTKKP